MSSSSIIDNWEPVSDTGVEDNEATLTYRKRSNSEGLDGSPEEPLTNVEHVPYVDGNEEKQTKYDAKFEEERKDAGISKISTFTTAKSPVRRKSGSSLDVTVPLNLKSTPADPHLSDVVSVSSATSNTGTKNTTALSSVNDIISNAEKDGQGSDIQKSIEASQPQSGAAAFFDNMISSLSFKAVPQQQEAVRTPNSPDIISHRRQPSINTKKASKRGSPPTNPDSPLKEAEKPKEMIGVSLTAENETFDSKRFVEEKYLDTPFHYGTPERNAEFHNLFKSVPEEDRLLDDFSCALSREFLYQGRIYISETHLCFYSSLLGWIAKVVTPFKDVTYMEKTSTAGLFPNAISIETEMGRTQFNGFISRDIAFTLIKEVWSRTLLAQGEKGNVDTLKSSSSESSPIDHHTVPIDSALHNRSYGELIRPNEPPSRTSYISENDSIIEDAIRSVDDYTPSSSHTDKRVVLSGDDEDDYDEDDDAYETTGDEKSKKTGYKFKPNVNYEYDGPYYAHETEFHYYPEDNNEYVLAEIECNAPPGVVFQLLFSETNPSFWLEFFKTQDSSRFSEIGRFDQVNQEGQHYREFTYAKGLHFPVGPKSTKCVVQETILHLDYSDYINVLNTTRTPDVPSGGSFSTKTRYMFRWASETTSVLKVSFWVDWTASSWIKSMVESSCKSGQIAATKDLVKFVQSYIDRYTVESLVNVSVSPPKFATRKDKPSLRSSISQPEESPSAIALMHAENTAIERNSKQLAAGNRFSAILLFIIIILLFLNLFCQISVKRDINKIKNSITFHALLSENKKWPKIPHALMDVAANPKLSNVKENMSSS